MSVPFIPITQCFPSAAAKYTFNKSVNLKKIICSVYQTIMFSDCFKLPHKPERSFRAKIVGVFFFLNLCNPRISKYLVGA